MRKSSITAAVVSGGFHTMRFIERLAARKPSLGIDDLSRMRRFLFLEYEPALGSNVHATPMFEALKRVVPDAITMVAGSHMAFEVFRHNPFIDYLVETPGPRLGLLRVLRSLRNHMKSTGFVPEIVITGLSSRQRGIALISFLARPAIRLGYTFAPELYDVCLRYDPQKSVIDNNLRLIERLGHQKQTVEPRVFYTREDLIKTENLLRESGIGNDTVRIVCVTQTSRTQRRSWPLDQLVSVLNHAHARYNPEIIFVGMSSEAESIDTLRAHIHGKTISLAGKTTIQMMAALFACSDLALTLDTGNLHLARSVGLPMVVLAPAWAPSVEWLPLGFDQYMVFLGDRAPSSSSGCEVIEIDAIKVIEALDRLLATYPPSDEERRRRAERSVSSVRE